MKQVLKVLFVWESDEEHSWNPVLAAHLRAGGAEVTEVHDLDALRRLDPGSFDICLPRFRATAANMIALDEALARAGMPMLNSRSCRVACENKGIAHLAFEEACLPQPRSIVVSREGVGDRRAAWSGETVVKPLYGSRGAGVEIHDSPEQAMRRAVARREDLVVQELIWPARCWRVIVGRNAGVVDPYWRRPPAPDQRVLSISTGSTIARDPVPPAVEAVATAMNAAVDGDLLAVDVLEHRGEAFALEINHNFDAHGGDRPAFAAFRCEIEAKLSAGPAAAGPSAVDRVEAGGLAAGEQQVSGERHLV
jgi:glutathione synthase/RimK-type ligase-like ATP-grasp enzyme